MLSGNRSKHEDAQIITVTDKCLVRAPRPTWRRARLASERRGIAVREEGQRAKLRLQRRLVDSNVTPELCRWPGVIRDQREENVIRIHGIRSAKSGLLGSTVQGDACVFRERSSGNSLNSRQKRKDVQRSRRRDRDAVNHVGQCHSALELLADAFGNSFARWLGFHNDRMGCGAADILANVGLCRRPNDIACLERAIDILAV